MSGVDGYRRVAGKDHGGRVRVGGEGCWTWGLAGIRVDIMWAGTGIKHGWMHVEGGDGVLIQNCGGLVQNQKGCSRREGVSFVRDRKQ